MPEITLPEVIPEKETNLLVQYQTAIQKPEVQNFLLLSKQIQKILPDLKRIIGSDMLEKGEKKRLINDNIEITTTAVTRPKMVNKSEVPEDYYTLNEVDEEQIVVQNGKIYQKDINQELVKNNLKLGVNIPGYVLEQSPRVSIKINGETI